MDSIEKLNKDFTSWSGYPLEGNDLEEVNGCIKTVLWNLEGELNQEADAFENRAKKLFPEQEEF